MAVSKILKPVAGVVILVGLYAAAGYVGVPAGVRWAVDNVVPDVLGGRTATVGDVSFNPWTWTLSVRDLTVKSAHAPANPLLTLRTFEADVSGDTLFEMAPVVERLTVDGLNVHLTANEKNNKEAKEAVKEQSGAAGASSGLPAFSLADVRVTNSNVRLTNPGNGADVRITDIDFALPLVSTLPASGTLTAAPKLSLKIDGTPIAAQGTLKGRTAELALKVSSLDVARILKAAPVTLPVFVQSASVSCDLKAAIEMPESGEAAVKVSGTASAANVDVRDAKKKPFVSLTSASVAIDSLDPTARKAAVKSVTVRDPKITAAVNTKQGAGKSESGAGSEEPSSSDGAWTWSVGSVDLTNGRLSVTDTGLTPDASLSVSAINLKASNLSAAKGKTASYSASAKVAGGSLSSAGNLSVNPLSVKATTQVKALQFAPFNPWVKSLAGAQLTKGTADVNGKLDMSSGKDLSLKWNGDLAVGNLEAKNAQGKTLMTWTQAAATGVDVQSISPVNISVANLTVKEPAKKATQSVKKAADLVGLLASLTGHENTARRAQKTAEVVSQDISVSNLVYKDGKFSAVEEAADKAKNALSALLVESLNSVFAAGGK